MHCGAACQSERDIARALLSRNATAKYWGLSAGTGKLCIFGHLGLVFIWSCFVSCLLLLLYYVICAPVLTEGTEQMRFISCAHKKLRQEPGLDWDALDEKHEIKWFYIFKDSLCTLFSDNLCNFCGLSLVKCALRFRRFLSN